MITVLYLALATAAIGGGVFFGVALRRDEAAEYRWRGNWIDYLRAKYGEGR